MYPGSLFERLAPKESKESFDTFEEALYSSIATNLSQIFSTNAGSSESAIDYGRPDLDNSTLSKNDSLESIERNSEICIKKYEPRLFKSKVHINKERLHFNEMNIFIEGFIHLNGKIKKIHYKADLLKSGGVKVYKDGI